MTDDIDDDDDERVSHAVDDGSNGTTADVVGGNNNHRKRRLSKRERKNLKRNRPVVVGLDVGGGRREEEDAIDASPDDAVVPATSSTAPSSSLYRTDGELGWTLEEYMAEYVPTPKPSRKVGVGDGDDASSDNDDDNNNNNDNSKSLGRWFPKASVIKSSVCYSNDYLAKIAKARKSRRKGENATEGAEGAEAEAEEEEEEPKASLVLFYQYVSPPWSPAKVTALLSYLAAIAGHRTNVGGRIRVSSEGVNATVSAASSSSSSSSSSSAHDGGSGDGGGRPASFRAAAALRHLAEDLRRFDPRSFASADFKYVDGLSADRHFKELKLIPVKELVFYGIREDDVAVVAGGKGGGVHLDPRDYHEMLKRDDAVVIDVRNHYEAAIGRFEGQMMGGMGGRGGPGPGPKEGGGDRDSGGEAGGIDDDDDDDGGGARGGGGARYIDPKMRKSTDFTSWLAEPETRQKLEGKTVLMFCTGGIRCERASAYLNSRMGSDLKGVYQLKGGVERYLQSFPDGGFWRGKNFVFDKREAIGPGNFNGYGLSSAAVGKGKDDDGKLLSWGTECAGCRRPWDRYVGKRKCYTCGVPVLVCDACMSGSTSSAQKKKGKRKKKNAKEEEAAQSAENDASGRVEAVDDKPRREGSERVRCPLCIEEGVTVPAEEVEYTDNGVRGRRRSSSFAEDGGFREDSGVAATCKPANAKDDDARKAARSVCKWGGGHAAWKKEKRKFSRRPCQFGADCTRKDCFFYHQE